MARYVIVENGVVTNAIEAEADFADEIGAIASDNAGIGWTYEGGEFAPPEPDPVGPNLAPLAPWQFWAMLRISGQEQAVKDFVIALPEPAKSVASSQLEFSLEFRRDHSLVENVRAILGMTTEQLDELWDQGHQLSL